MIQCGNSPFYECSTQGDIRFSAFGAKIKARGNLSIESIYQAHKVFEDKATGLQTTGLPWYKAKGLMAINQADCDALYGKLWDEYIAENPELIEVLKSKSGLQDKFGYKGHSCQATELWRIRNENNSLFDL